MIVQIYGVMNPGDGAMVAALGADQIGVVVGERGTARDEVDFESANHVFEAINPGVTKVALTLSSETREIEAVIRAVHPDVLHLAAALDTMQPAQVGDLKQRHPGLRVIRTIPVTGPESISAASAFYGVADCLLLDSRDPDTMSVGATGQRHDWAISAQIVATVRTPVILAGGLSPDNVREAIRAVRPWGVDSNALTNRDDDRTRKDPERVRRFIEIAQASA
jgi:phosphoribosylanthranilate isomerase